MESSNVVSDLLKYQKLFKKAEEAYLSLEDGSQGKNRDRDYYQRMLVEGTLNDKIGALVGLIKMTPQTCLKHIKSLLDLSRSKNRRVAEQAINSLKDVFLTVILKDDQKLWTF